MVQPTELFCSGARMKKQYDRQFSATASRFGLTASDIHLLLFLADHPDCDTARDISERIFLPKSCVSRSVDSLIRRGFLSSRGDERDRRIAHLSLLPASAALVEEGRRIRQDFFSLMFRGFSPEERRQLDHLAQKISNNLREAFHYD